MKSEEKAIKTEVKPTAEISRTPAKETQLTSPPPKKRQNVFTRRAPALAHLRSVGRDLIEDNWHKLEPVGYLEYVHKIDHLLFLRVAAQKLWTLINPNGLDMIIKVRGKSYPGPAHFVKYVLNPYWSPFLETFLRHRLAYGYVAVTYIPAPRDLRDCSAQTVYTSVARTKVVKQSRAATPNHGSDDGSDADSDDDEDDDENGSDDEDEHQVELIPVVVPASHYRLEWIYDDYRQRIYRLHPLQVPHILDVQQATGPLGDLLNLGSHRFTEQEIQSAQLFVYDEPTDFMQISSPIRDSLKYILNVEQILLNFVDITTSQANVPLVEEKQVQPVPGSGSVLAPNRTFGLNTESGHIGDLPSGRPYVENVIKMDLMEHAARRSAENRTSSAFFEDAIRKAEARTERPIIECFDERSGRLLHLALRRPWERSKYDMPAGSTLGQITVPEPPKILPQVTSTMFALVCATCNVPVELILGAFGKDIRISSTDMAKASLDAVIKQHRQVLSRLMEHIFWKLYGDEYVSLLSSCSLIAGREAPSRREIRATCKEIEIEFKFSDAQTTWQDVYNMYALHLVTKEAVLAKLIEQCPDISEKQLDHTEPAPTEGGKVSGKKEGPKAATKDDRPLYPHKEDKQPSSGHADPGASKSKQTTIRPR